MNVSDLEPGMEFGPAPWFTIGQARIDQFAAATEDRQWVHTDPVRAATGPFGTTIAHGWLTLSLAAPSVVPTLGLEAPLIINYGCERVRFPSAVPEGSEVRPSFRVKTVTDLGDATHLVVEMTVNLRDAPKPACIAELALRVYR